MSLKGLKSQQRRIAQLELQSCSGPDRIDPSEIADEEWAVISVFHHEIRSGSSAAGDGEITDAEWAELKRRGLVSPGNKRRGA
jgi:hypothetical protein